MRSWLRFLVVAVLGTLLLAGCECKHEYDQGTITKEAACKEEGIRTYTCQKCGESYEESIPLLEHVYKERVTRFFFYDKDW